MTYTIEHIASRLKSERKARGLSQRELSQLSGLPQSHISKIENGTVDLRLSSLIELARVLGLELTLVPKKVLPAITSIIKGSIRHPNKAVLTDASTQKILKRIQNSIKRLAVNNPAIIEFAQAQRQIHDLTQLAIPEKFLESIQSANQMLKKYELDTSSVMPLREMLAEFQSIRNSAAHIPIGLSEMNTAKPAYSLGDGDG